MNSEQVKIKKIKIKNLAQFARSALHDPAYGDVAPISILRAESQSRNPQADPNDIALLVALRDNRCIGFHGLLPGLIQNKGQVSKVYWLVTFYLEAAARGRGHGKQLVKEIQKINADLVTTGITEAAAGVYRSAGFQQLGELPYYQLQPDNADFFADAGLHLESRTNEFRSQSVSQLSEEFNQIEEGQDSSISFQRDIQTINWMIRRPWVVSRQNARQDVKHYYFSRIRDLFEYVCLELYTPDGSARIGYLVLSISRKKNRTTVKILDYFFKDSKDLFIPGYFAIKYARRYGADSLESPLHPANFGADQIGAAHRIKKKKRLYLYYPKGHASLMARLADKIRLGYCDGDTAFT